MTAVPPATRFRLPGLGALLLAAACACSPASSAATPSPTGGSDMTALSLSSPSFGEGGSIPARHTCDDQDVSPALSWRNGPADAASYALIVDDPDARGFVHWVVYDIPGGLSGSLPEGVRPSDRPPQGRNDFGRTGWGGPCPPGGTHHYLFTLLALSATLGLGGSPSAADVRSAAAGRILAQTVLTATYTRR